MRSVGSCGYEERARSREMLLRIGSKKRVGNDDDNNSTLVGTTRASYIFLNIPPN